MKIAFFNVTASFIPGGLETYCWEAGRALARRGVAPGRCCAIASIAAVS